MKRILSLLAVTVFILSAACQKYSRIGEKDSQSVFLDEYNGKVIYINNSNRVVDYVDLKLNEQEIKEIRTNKELNDSLQKMKDWGDNTIAGTKYSLNLATRFYNDKLLYILELKPYDDNITRLANTITVDLTDIVGFTLETIDPERWTRSVDAEGNPQQLTARGSIPITLENYLEIYDWNPYWRN
jgi:hypothetical protein